MVKVKYCRYGYHEHRELNLTVGAWEVRLSLGQLGLWHQHRVVWMWLAGEGVMTGSRTHV